MGRGEIEARSEGRGEWEREGGTERRERVGRVRKENREGGREERNKVDSQKVKEIFRKALMLENGVKVNKKRDEGVRSKNHPRTAGVHEK